MSSYCLIGGHTVLVGGPELRSGVGIWLWESLKYRHEVVTDHKQWEPLKYRHEVINLLSSFLPPPPTPTSPFYGLHFSLPPPPISFHANLSYHSPSPPPLLPFSSPTPHLSLTILLSLGEGGGKQDLYISYIPFIICLCIMCLFISWKQCHFALWKCAHFVLSDWNKLLLFSFVFQPFVYFDLFSQHWQSALVLLLLLIVSLFVCSQGQLLWQDFFILPVLLNTVCVYYG